MRRLLARRAQRRTERAFVAEGIEVVRTGLAAGHVPESVYLAAGAAEGGAAAEVARQAAALGARIHELAPGVIERVAATVTPQPVLAVFPSVDVPEVPAGAQLVVVMAGVRDPGNAGTVIRSADAAGVAAVVACGDTVDPYNPKTVRSSAGSIFHVPLVVREDTAAALGELADAGLRRVGAVLGAQVDYATRDWSVPSALVLGNEATGLASTLPLDEMVEIPMAGRAESLNVGMACAVICFEALRQRRSGGSSRVPRMPR